MTGEKTLKYIAKKWKADAEEHFLGRKVPVLHIYDPDERTLIQGFSPLDDTIYVLAHCSKGGQQLAASRTRFRGRAEVGPEELVARLRQYVPSQTVNFKLLACYGGACDTGGEGGGTIVRNPSFASTLFRHLKSGFSGAILSAYLLPISAGLDPDGHKRVSFADGPASSGATSTRPSSHRVVFGI